MAKARPGPESRWRRHSDAVIAEVLSTLPKDMPAKEKRRLVNEHYPFGQRQYLPYKHWCRALNDAIPGEQKPVEPKGFRFKPTEGLPSGYRPFIDAILERPNDAAARLIFADYLAEQGDGNDAGVREPKVEENAVAARLFGPGARIVHVGHVNYPQAWGTRRVHSLHGRDLMPAQIITDHIRGNPLLVYPELVEAICVEKNLAAMRLFGTVKEKR